MTASMPVAPACSTRKRWILMNSEEWIFGCQVRNQSVENGNMPFGGDTPLSSLYSLSRRSRDSDTSDSSNCSRAPSWISSIASRISWASDTTLFLVMICAPAVGGLNDFFDGLAGHQDSGVG